MKKTLFTSLLASLFLISCTCKDGYGPNDCDMAWADHYTGQWNGTVSCTGGGNAGTFDVFSNFTKQSAKRVSVDGSFFIELTDWDAFEIPSQIMSSNQGQGTVTGSGTLETFNTNNGGIITSSSRVRMTLNINVNNNLSQCVYVMTR